MPHLKPLVSIIIPVYNVYPYLNDCVTSVVEQSYQDLEIILVDDGSPDKSGQLCDAWGKTDHRIKVIHQKNAGLNMARRTGFTASTGDYITFLDSDDLFHRDAMKNTVAVVLKEGVDAVMFQFKEFSDQVMPKNELSGRLNTKYEIRTSVEDAFRLLITNTYDNFYPMTAWGKLYSRQLIQHVDWKRSNLRAFEDNFFTPQVFDTIQSFAFLEQQLYFYRRNDLNSNVLSKTITGNTLNGKPIGYLEYLSVLRGYWRTFLEKHAIPLDVDLDEFWLSNMLWRFNNLTKEHLLCEENNINYLPELIEYLLLRYGRDIGQKQATIDQLTHRVALLEERAAHVQSLEAELSRLKTVRGSARNAASQLKRRIVKKPSV
ncbi:MAG: glycosyltransferase family 2 protein [Candidatus Saccharibacteria bacterium]|nr:glycosyltransferase family 2 protein [Candidatus Saccharibacteria bacterium]